MSDDQLAGTLTTEALLQQLRDVKASKREQAIAQLAERADPSIPPALVEVLEGDRNENVRIQAARTLGTLGNDSVLSPLVAALASDASKAIRASVAEALGNIDKEEAVPALGEAAREDRDLNVRIKAVEALHKIGGTRAIDELLKTLQSRTPPSLRSQIVWRLGELKDRKAIPAIQTILLTDTDDSPARSAATALAQILDSEAVPTLLDALWQSANRKAKLRVVEELGNLSNADIVSPLCHLILTSGDGELREAAVATLTKVIKWRAKTDEMVVLLKRSSLERSQIQSTLIYMAISPAAEELAQQPHLLIDYLIANALSQDERMTGIFAELISTSVQNDLALAATRLDAYMTANNLSGKELQALRLEIGGKKTLSSLTEQLTEDLVTYFRKPIKELNDQTYERWNTTIKYGQWGFLARVVMSLIVFIVGIWLVVASGSQLLFGKLNSEQLWGPGISFVSGLATMLLVIYTGPLREISAAVIDLGIANAAFIAFVHRVSQISHTYSFHYLQEKITFEETSKSTTLIKEALDDTILKLSEDRSGASEGIFTRVVDKLFALNQPTKAQPNSPPTSNTAQDVPKPEASTLGGQPAETPQPAG